MTRKTAECDMAVFFVTLGEVLIYHEYFKQMRLAKTEKRLKTLANT